MNVAHRICVPCLTSSTPMSWRPPGR